MAGGLRIADAPAISQLEGTDKLPVSVGDNEAHSVEAEKIKGFVNGSELDGSTVLGRIKNLETNLANEIQTRTEADTSLGDHKADKSYVDAELLAEANEREQQDTALQHKIDDEATERGNADATLQQNIDNEALARQNADGSLQQAINDERDARILAIGDEATARDNADNTLQGNIDAEATTRGNADLNLQHNIDAEATIRHDADVTLQGNIDAEQQARILADNAEQLARQNADDALNTAKANKDEMAVVNGTGANADKVTIQLKGGLSATVLKTHQDISGKADKDTDAVQGNVAVFDANGNPVDSGSAIEETPTENSVNLSKSGGIWSWVTGLLSSLREWVSGVFAAKDGYYSTLTAGAAENLVGQTIDSEAYLIRTTGGAENEVANGVASVLSMEGNSCVWKQVFTMSTQTKSSMTLTNNGDGSFTLNGTGSADFFTGISSTLTNGHKYALRIFNFEYNEGQGVYFWSSIPELKSKYGTQTIIFNNIATSGSLDIITTSQSSFTNHKIGVDIIDLTLLGIDNLTTVAQVEAWLAQHVGTKPYYAYNAGTILSAQTLGIKTYGQNLLNPTTKQAKLIPYTWEENSNVYTIKNVPSGATATFTPDNTGVAESITITNNEFDITSYGSGILELSSATSNTYVCMKWDGTKDDDVVPYEDHTYDFDVRKVYGKVNGAGEYVQCFPNGMMATKVNNIAADELTAEHAIAKNIKVNLGDVGGWEGGFFNGVKTREITNSLAHSDATLGYSICNKYLQQKLFNNNMPDNSYVLNSHSHAVNTLGIYDTSITSADIIGGKIAKLNGVYLVYRLATPITYTDLIYRDGGIDRPLADVLMNIEVNNWSMEEQLITPYDNGNPTSIPATIKTQYGMDAVEAIDTLQKTSYFADDVHANLQALLTCINTNCSTVLGGTFAVSDTATEKVFSFTFTPNEEPEP